MRLNYLMALSAKSSHKILHQMRDFLRFILNMLFCRFRASSSVLSGIVADRPHFFLWFLTWFVDSARSGRRSQHVRLGDVTLPPCSVGCNLNLNDDITDGSCGAMRPVSGAQTAGVCKLWGFLKQQPSVCWEPRVWPQGAFNDTVQESRTNRSRRWEESLKSLRKTLISAWEERQVEPNQTGRRWTQDAAAQDWVSCFFTRNKRS